jgi:F-type H+-transporting ATPase subunit a
MSETNSLPELPNFVTILAEKFHGTSLANFLHSYENFIFSFLVSVAIVLFVYFSVRKFKFIPGRRQVFLEMVFGGLDDFTAGVLGKNSRKHLPFLGTLFIYIFVMNLIGLIPFLKSPTSSWSVTLALSLCVFAYVQYTALKDLGLFGYVDHLAGNPRGPMAWSLILPATMFVLHLLAELVRPLSLSLRLRTNIWGEDMMLAMMAGMGLKGLPLLFFMTLLALMSAIIQAVVFSLLAMVYLALVTKHEEAH